MILSKEELEITKSLSVSFNKSAGLNFEGGITNSRAGGNNDFADYRHFMPGDDIRNIDWHHYTDKRMLVLKERERIESPVFSIYIDLSDSVVCGGEKKILAVKKTAAVLIYLLLQYNMKIKLVNADIPSKVSTLPVQYAEYLFYVVENMIPGGDKGAGKIKESLSTVMPGERLIIISDLVCPQGPEYLLSALAGKSQQTVIFNIFTGIETQPDLSGSYILDDAENDSQLSVFVDNDIISEYKKIYRKYFEIIRHCAARNNWPYYDINADLDMIDNLKQITTNGMLYI